MDDLISRQAAIDAIYHHLPSVSRTRARTMLHEVPSAQPERPIGEWIVSESEEVGALGIRYRTYTCPSCGWNHSLIIPRNFCPNCGSDNRGEES